MSRATSNNKAIARRRWGWIVRVNGETIGVYKSSEYGGMQKALKAAEAGLGQYESVVRGLSQIPTADTVRDVVGYRSVLTEAEDLVNGPRRGDYGHPLDDFRRSAKMMTGVLLDKLQPGTEITWQDIPLLMECVKMSREVNYPKRDNRVDGAGYWETKEMCETENDRRLVEGF